MARTYVWDMRNPDGAAMGLEFARGSSAPTDRMLGHAVPERVNVVVRDEEGTVVARGEDLRDDSASTPMSRFTLRDGGVERRNVWPGEDDLETPVILPGGEVGILKAWWNALDGRVPQQAVGGPRYWAPSQSKISRCSITCWGEPAATCARSSAVAAS
jgi:hypothetical protein